MKPFILRSPLYTFQLLSGLTRADVCAHVCVKERKNVSPSLILSFLLHPPPCFSHIFSFSSHFLFWSSFWVFSPFYPRHLIRTTWTQVTSHTCVNNSSCLLFFCCYSYPLMCWQDISFASSPLPHPSRHLHFLHLLSQPTPGSLLLYSLSLDHSFFPHPASPESFISTQHLTTTLHFPVPQPILWLKSSLFLNYKERPSFTPVSISLANCPHFKVNTSEMFPQLLRCPCPFPLPISCSGLRQTLSFSTKIFLHHLMQCPNGFIQPSFPLTSSHTPHQNIPTGITFFCWQNYVCLSLNPDIFFPILLFP